MNDFTKEELKELHCKVYGKPGILSFEDLACLGMKLQYMIEDYCEHESTENIGGSRWKCVKCGMLFGDERY